MVEVKGDKIYLLLPSFTIFQVNRPIHSTKSCRMGFGVFRKIHKKCVTLSICGSRRENPKKNIFIDFLPNFFSLFFFSWQAWIHTQNTTKDTKKRNFNNVIRLSNRKRKRKVLSKFKFVKKHKNWITLHISKWRIIECKCLVILLKFYRKKQYVTRKLKKAEKES